jgi:hypothetical protein
LGELVVVEELAGVVGDDELVFLFAVPDGIAVTFLILDQADDLVFVFFAIRRLDDQDVAEFDFPSG